MKYGSLSIYARLTGEKEMRKEPYTEVELEIIKNQLLSDPTVLNDEHLEIVASSSIMSMFSGEDRQRALNEMRRRRGSGLPSDQKLSDVVAKAGDLNDFSLTFIKTLASTKLRLIINGTVPYPTNVIKAAKDELNAREEMCGETKPSTIGITGNNPKTALDIQHGGDHYKKLGNHQPWEVLRAWLTPEEFRGYMKGTAIAYLAREQSKGKNLDISKAVHTLQAYQELSENKQENNTKNENTEGDTARP